MACFPARHSAMAAFVALEIELGSWVDWARGRTHGRTSLLPFPPATRFYLVLALFYRVTWLYRLRVCDVRREPNLLRREEVQLHQKLPVFSSKVPFLVNSPTHAAPAPHLHLRTLAYTVSTGLVVGCFFPGTFVGRSIL